MSKFDYSKAQATAQRLIDKFGDGGSFTRTSQGNIDPVTGNSTGGSTLTISGTITPILSYKNSEVDGASIMQGDGYAYFDGQGLRVGDYTTVNNETWRVVSVSGITSISGVNVYQKVQVRR